MARTCHVGITGVLFGGAVLGIPFSHLSGWHDLAIASGIVLIIIGVRQSRHWPYQGRGIMATLHVAVLGTIHIWPDLMVPLLTTALALGGIGSNMPGSVRHWSLLHGRRID